MNLVKTATTTTCQITNTSSFSIIQVRAAKPGYDFVMRVFREDSVTETLPKDYFNATLTPITSTTTKTASTTNSKTAPERTRILQETIVGNTTTFEGEDGRQFVGINFDNKENLVKYQLSVFPSDPTSTLIGSQTLNATFYDNSEEEKQAPLAYDLGVSFGWILRTFTIVLLVLYIIIEILIPHIGIGLFIIKHLIYFKLLARMRYINLDFGMAVEFFFTGLGDISSFNILPNPTDFALHSMKGKSYFSQDGVLITRDAPILLVAYLISWIFKAVVIFYKQKIQKGNFNSVWTIYLIDFLSRYNTSISLLASVDISFFAARTILFTSLPEANFEEWGAFFISVICCFLICVDVCYLIDHSLFFKSEFLLPEFHQ